MKRFSVLFALVAACLFGGFHWAKAAPPPAVDASITLDQAAVALGDTVTFTTTVPKLKGSEYPMVAVSCYQDVNGDGVVDTNLLGPDIVYAWLDHPPAGFLVGAYSSIWTLRGGGPAECRAELDSYNWHGDKGRQEVVVLASVGFHAGG